MNHSIGWRSYASQATTDRTPKAMPCKSLLSTQLKSTYTKEQKGVSS